MKELNAVSVKLFKSNYYILIKGFRNAIADKKWVNISKLQVKGNFVHQ